MSNSVCIISNFVRIISVRAVGQKMIRKGMSETARLSRKTNTKTNTKTDLKFVATGGRVKFLSAV